MKSVPLLCDGGKYLSLIFFVAAFFLLLIFFSSALLVCSSIAFLTRW